MSEVLTPVILTKTLTNANEEYSQALPAGCKHFSMQCRTGFEIRFAFETGKVAGSTEPFATMKVGTGFTAPEKFQAAAETLYLACAAAGKVVEIVAWVPA